MERNESKIETEFNEGTNYSWGDADYDCEAIADRWYIRVIKGIRNFAGRIRAGISEYHILNIIKPNDFR